MGHPFWTKTVPSLTASKKMGANRNARNWIQPTTKMILKANSSLEPQERYVALFPPWFLPCESLHGHWFEPCYTWSFDLWDNKCALFSTPKFFVICYDGNYEIKKEQYSKDDESHLGCLKGFQISRWHTMARHTAYMFSKNLDTHF